VNSVNSGAALLLCAALAPAAALAGASSAPSRYCDQPAALTAGQQDRLLRTSALLSDALQRSGRRVALVARSGLDLGWFGLRYSHAGVSLQTSPATPWAVRQLYFACDEGQPRLFDQGLPAFLLGTDNPSLGYVSVLLLPEAEGIAVEALASDNRRALSLLGAAYSANAYVFSTRYQNCNQWLVELLALAFGAAPGASPRESAQAWLAAQQFEGTVYALGWRPLLSLTGFSPYLHLDDHPEHEQAQAQLRVSMPQSIEAFVRRLVPGTERIELCHTDTHAVIRRGWTPLADGCLPEPGDTVVSLKAVPPPR